MYECSLLFLRKKPQKINGENFIFFLCFAIITYVLIEAKKKARQTKI